MVENSGDFAAKYALYGGAVYRLAMNYLASGPDSEDVMQEAFVRLLTRAPAFADAGHEKRWLLRVTANLCKNKLRSPWHTRRAPAEALQQVAAPDGERQALELVFGLPAAYRVVLYLHCYEGYSVKEVAQLLRFSQSAVKMRLKRGRDLLRLEREEERR